MKPNVRGTYQMWAGEHVLIGAFLCCLLVLCSACEQANKKEIIPVAVNEQLQEAYARALQYNHMYTMFVARAEQEHKQTIAELFTALARSEDIRAMMHAHLLLARGVQPVAAQQEQLTVGNVHQMLKMAMSSENIQYYDLYPNAIKTAVAAKDTAALNQFLAAIDLDARHRELINDAFNQLDRKSTGTYSLCDRCGYIFTTDRANGCPVCRKFKMKPEQV